MQGVTRVVDQLEVRHGELEEDAYLTNLIRRKLDEDPRVSPGQVKVFVEDGMAFLTGQVYTVDAKIAAGEVAGRVDGINGISNDIEVKAH